MVTLALIPLLFYLLLQPNKLSKTNYLVVTAVITSALFLTHVFSAIVLEIPASAAYLKPGSQVEIIFKETEPVRNLILAQAFSKTSLLESE